MRFLQGGDRRFLADEPGLGKSAQLVRASVGDTLVIAPATIIDGGTWDDETARWGNGTQVFTQATYTSLNQRVKTGKGGNRPVAKLRPEVDRPWGTLILDEAHNIKTRQTSWTIACQRIAERSDRVYLATGTPMPNWPHELFTLLQILEPGEARPGGRLGSYWRWVEGWFTVLKNPHGGEHSKMIRGLRGCSPMCAARPVTDPCDHYATFVGENLGDRYLMRLRDDVLRDLPPLTGPVKVECRMSREQSRVYRELRDSLISDTPEGEELVAWSQGAKNVMLERCTTGLGLLGEGPPNATQSGKFDRLRYDLANRARPTLVVAHYRDTVEVAAQVARDVGARAVTIHGGTSKVQRGEAVRAFQQGRADVLVGSLETVSEGLTLTSADMVIMLEHSYKPSRNQQAIRRIHRMGQARPCIALDYVAVTDRGGKTSDGGKRELLAEKTDLQMRVITAAQFLRSLY